MEDSTAPREAPKVAHLRLPAELHQALSAFADRTHRSMNGAAVFLLEDALSRHAGPTGTESDVHLR